MKTVYLLAILAIVALSEAQRQFRPFPTTRLVNTNNPGSYRPSNDGRYTPDNSGSYKNNDGRYRPDDSGKYVHKDDKYKHVDYNYKYQGEKSGNDGGNAGNANSGSGSANFGSGNTNFVSGNTNFGSGVPASAVGVVGSGSGSGFGSGNNNNNGEHFATGQHIPIKRPAKQPGFSAASGLGQGIRNEPGNGHIPGLGQGLGAAYYGDQNDNRNYKIIRKIENVEQDGYHYLYETENGITGEEQGKLANVGTDEEAMKAHGFYTYTGPDNVVYTVRYTADENGFVPQGEHLPTPPPIPEAILRALEYQRSIGTL